MSLYSMLYNGGAHESDRQANPKGIALFFAVIRWHWGRLIGLNLMFILSCLPVVTIPCAMTAMSAVAGRLVQRRVCYPVHDYWRAFTREWKRSSLCGLALFGVLALALFGVLFYPRSGMPAGMALGGVCLVVAVFDVMTMMMAFPMVAFTDLPVRRVLRNAALVTQMRLGWMLLAFAASAVVLVATYAFLPYTVVVMPLFGFSLIALIGVFAAWDGMKRFVVVDSGDFGREDAR
ncbi:YesL family protein [Bifidobacterium saguinibicoloris]|uniref:YesL family protein n=1 Tax=Bifidobacterium saguinibicoloris TaxID=2834433 RepID=UPI001C5705B4|nr:YesL family protein [Bifidobacterium saguinibicoloris]MBW3080483.1 YesL family protein [Bifidobacterium saguinibicoloris]